MLLATVTLFPLVFGAYNFIDTQLSVVQASQQKLSGKYDIDALNAIEQHLMDSRVNGSTGNLKAKILSGLDFWNGSGEEYPRSQIQYFEFKQKLRKNTFDQLGINDLTDSISLLKEHMAAESGLSLDSDPATFYLNDLYLTKLPIVTDFSSRVSAQALQILKTGNFTPQSYTYLVAVTKRLDELNQTLNKSTKRLYEFYEDYSEWMNAVKVLQTSTQSLIHSVNQKILEPDEFAISSNEFSQNVSKQQRALSRLQQSTSDLVENIQKVKVEQQESNMLYLALSILSVVMVSLYFFFSAFKAISQNVQLINQMTSNVANGDLSQNLMINSNDEFNEIANAFNQMLASIRHLISEVQKLSQDVVTASEQVQQVTADVEQNLHAQQEDTHQVASAISQLVSSVEAVGRNTEQATDITASAQEDVEQGQEVILRTVDGINLIAKEVSLGAEAINQLAQHADDIGKVVDVIHGIAEQTNLLALNAAIEAARAGEQGRGFAVVADEVRTLASRTAASTDEIRRMIELVQSATSKAVETMESGSQRANQGVEHANEVSISIDNVTKRVQEVVVLSQQIAEVVAEQRSATGQVDEKTHAIERGATGSLSSAQSASEIGKVLAQDAKKLAAQISDFRI
ncbi:methyl-accepting chemotaxis protein [Parashewanella spongiae]|nr:methyl-accepting chemotaxis protein [Parashewanella spongiae]MCL1076761.1 methyl-accepting chemotaxis protein [Parashewanella spongiae]